MNDLRRWLRLDRTLLLSIAVIAFFAVMDIKQISGWSQVSDANKWVLYEGFSAPAIFGLWIVTLAVMGVVWALATKDTSEGLAVFFSPLILLLFGLEDLFVYLFSGERFPVCLTWLNDNVGVGSVAKFFGYECVTGASLVLSVLIGFVLSYVVYGWLKRYR